MGLIIANLIGLAFARLPIIGAYGPIVFNIVFGYAGMSIAVRKKSEIIALVGNLRLGRPNKEHSKRKELEFSGKLLDTSAIIDGASLRLQYRFSRRTASWCRSSFWKSSSSSPIRRTY